MLINELRTTVKNYDNNKLTNIVCELYKRIPKKIKEEYNIDDYIKDINVKRKKSDEILSFDQVKTCVISFLQLVDEGLYSRPNKIVSRKDRSNWRFKGKKIFKYLCSYKPGTKEGNTATDLLIEFYKRLSIGTYSLLFTNWDTFKALGVTQDDYYQLIVNRVLFNGLSEENLHRCISLLDLPVSGDLLSEELYSRFIYSLDGDEPKKISIKLLNDIILNTKEEMLNSKRESSYYDFENKINECVVAILQIYITMNKCDEGIKFFHKNYIEKNKEIKEYVLLRELHWLELDEEWIKEYESNVQKINFRDSINEEYLRLKNKN